MNTTFVWTVHLYLQWIRYFLWKVQVCSEYDFCLKKVQCSCNTCTFFQYVFTAFSLRSTTFPFAQGEYDFSLKSTSLQWIRLFVFERYKAKVVCSASLQWIRLFFEKVQVCSEYNFSVNTPFLWKVQVCSEYDFSLKGTSLQWIRLFFERYKFAVNTTFVWKVQFSVNTTFRLCKGLQWKV